jgi:hypothetical protein
MNVRSGFIDSIGNTPLAMTCGLYWTNMEPLIIARSVHSLFGADIRDWNNAMRRQAFWYRGAVRHCLPGKCRVLHHDEPTMACLAVESFLSEDAVLIVGGARETRSSKVRVPPPINLGRAVLQPS